MKKINGSFLIPLLLLMIGCGINKEKKYIREYYPSGKILSYGLCNKDSVYIDTLYKFYENGKLSEISVYDSTGGGKLSGMSTLFYPNGAKYQVSNYLLGEPNGFAYEYSTSERLFDKIHYWDGKQVGDYYEYDTLRGILNKYAFYNFKGNYTNYTEYDTLGLIKKNESASGIHLIFFDSVKVYIDSLEKNKTKIFYDLLLIISNPPRCNSTLFIEYFSENGILMHRDSINNKPIYFKRNLFIDSLKEIKYFARQYDSTTNKEIYQKISVPFQFKDG